MTDALHEAVAARTERGEFPGAVTLVARGDRVVADAVGVTTAGGTEPMRRDTPFRIASMTKPVLAVAALMLAEEERLDLGEPVTRLLPELSHRRVLARPDGPLDETVEAVRAPTVADLLTSTSGFGMVVDGDTVEPPWPIVRAGQESGLGLGPPEPRTPYRPDEWIRRYAELPLIHQPGEKWLYNADFLVLGALLARAADQDLADLLRERVFEPLGMAHTGFSLPAGQAARLPGQYRADPATGRLTENTATRADVWTEIPAFPSGCGGLVSTADDYLAFGRLLLDRGVHRGRRLLDERSADAITTNHLTRQQIAGGGRLLGGSGWGYGLAVTVAPDESSGAGRYGWSGGYGTDWFNDPAADLTVVLLTQVSDTLWNGAMTEFCRLAYDVV